MQQQGWRLFVKKALDRAVATVALVLFSPVLLVVALLVRWKLGSPVLFYQQRPGWKARPFWALKFRTMADTRDEHGQLLPDDARLSSFGRWMRSMSMDELPQFWNVLRGDLSLVGPRPLLMRYLDRYTPEQARRHDVLPGITGWTQVNGRNALTWEEKFELDGWYVENWSLALDCRILWLTLIKVVSREGISSADSATMPEFMGSNTGSKEMSR